MKFSKTSNILFYCTHC